MSVLLNRIVPEGLIGLVSATHYPEALQSLLRVATIPSRRRRLFRVRFGNQYLWLKANKTVFNTRPSAKAAVSSWLYYALSETVTRHRGWYYDDVATRRLLGPAIRQDQSVYDFVDQQVARLFADGTLIIEEISLSEAAPSPEERPVGLA